MIEKIEYVLDTYIRPKLSEHYGNVEIVDYKNGTLRVKLTGKCSNCPSAKYTVEDIIENQIKEHISEIKEVVLIESISDELLDFAKQLLKRK